jgi:hypothetical protein
MPYLMLPVPLWLVLLLFLISVILTIGLFVYHQHRLNKQAESIVNMDDWADLVEQELHRYRAMQRNISDKYSAPKPSLYDQTVF